MWLDFRVDVWTAAPVQGRRDCVICVDFCRLVPLKRKDDKESSLAQTALWLVVVFSLPAFRGEKGGKCSICMSEWINRESAFLLHDAQMTQTPFTSCLERRERGSRPDLLSFSLFSPGGSGIRLAKDGPHAAKLLQQVRRGRPRKVLTPLESDPAEADYFCPVSR